MDARVCCLPPLMGLDLTMVSNLLTCTEIEWLTHIPFEKSSEFSRYRILGANGIILLSIPVKKHVRGAFLHEIEIDYNQNWRHQHWRSIESAYGKSPFFNHFREDLAALYESKLPFLWQFAMDWAEWLIKIYTKSNRIPVKMTRNLLPLQPEGVLQLSYKLALRTSEIDFRYQQVFGKEFVPGLSVLDHLFCAGPKFWNLQN
jgi:hypothetical protein